jgi:hypothetical protein
VNQKPRFVIQALAPLDGREDDGEPCPDCAEVGKCPRCGRPGLKNEALCEACGWMLGDVTGAEGFRSPEGFCFCWLDEPEGVPG